jgi:hypothetical protein
MWKTIVATTFIAGTLDISAASLSAFIRSGATPGRVLRFVASGVFGQQAFTGSSLMLLWGLIFHFLIAFACTACFFLAYPKWKLLVSNPWMNSVIVGVAAWVVTELIIVPASNAPGSPFTLTRILISMGVLVLCIGTPIAWSAHKHYK